MKMRASRSCDPRHRTELFVTVRQLQNHEVRIGGLRVGGDEIAGAREGRISVVSPAAVRPLEGCSSTPATLPVPLDVFDRERMDLAAFDTATGFEEPRDGRSIECLTGSRDVPDGLRMDRTTLRIG